MPSLYLIRHGIAEERGTYEDDAQRPLTDEGCKKTKQVAKRLYDLGLRFDLLQTSPLVRAQQTSDIFADVFGDCLVLRSPELAPEGDFETWLNGIAEWISQHPQVNPKDYYSKFNAARKGFSRPQFRYLLALTEG